MECLGQVCFVQRESCHNISKASQNVRFIYFLLQRGVVLFECFDVHWIDANLWPLRCLGASPVTHSLFPLWQQICFIPWQRIRFPCLLLLTRIEGKVQPTENSCPPTLLMRFDGVSCWIHGCMGQLKHLFPEGSKEIGKQNANTPHPPAPLPTRTCAQRTFQPLAVQIHGCEKCN